MTETENKGKPESDTEIPANSGPSPYVIDPELAARCFWTGVVAGEQGQSGDKLLEAFTAAITYTYPSTERHDQIQKMARAFVRVMGETRKKPDGRKPDGKKPDGK